MPFLQIRAYGADPEAALQLGKNGGPPQHGANSSRATAAADRDRHGVIRAPTAGSRPVVTRLRGSEGACR